MSLSLVTGATGFIGQRLTNALDGEIRVLSREKKTKYDTVLCDFESDYIPENAFTNVTKVFHLAGFSHDLRDETKLKDLYYKINVNATLNLAKLAVKHKVKKFIFISSVKAGGTPKDGICATEKQQTKPKGAYGVTKLEAEVKLIEIGKKSSMDVLIIRPSLVYGPDVKGNLSMMLSGIKQGWFPPLPKNANKRSMIHVDDLVRAILFIDKNVFSNGEIFIATDSNSYSSNEIYNTLCQLSGKSIPKWTTPEFLFGIISLLSPNIRYKVKKLLGDECYSSSKLEELGFIAKKSLKDMNETDF